MHDCLLVEDILQNVFEQVRLEVRGGHRTLLALATTCRAFCEPALDKLYHTLPSIHPIIRCLPQDVWQTAPLSRMEGALFINRPLEQHHWNTIARYSRRVRSLQLSFHSKNLEVYTALSSPPDPSYLFPFLRVLRWRCGSNDPTEVEQMMPFLKFTLRPSLYKISLTLSYIALQTHVDLHTLGTHCPNLQVLDISHIKAPEITDKLVCSCHNLRWLSAVQASEKSFQFIATSSILDYLSLVLVGVEPDMLRLWTRQCNFPIFPSLQDLSFQANSVRTAASFLELKSWSIREIMIALVDLTFDTATREQLFSLVQDQCDRDQLESLTIAADSLDPADTPVVDLRTFLPLMAFGNLTEVALFSVMALAIDDNALEQMVMAWPRLQKITIIQHRGSYVCPNITFLGLALLLKHCPDLSSFNIPVNAQIIPAHLSLPCNTLIDAINVNYSPITDPEAVAAFLSCMMPSLRKVISWSLFRIPVGVPGRDLCGWRRKWNVVSDRLSAEECG